MMGLRREAFLRRGEEALTCCTPFGYLHTTRLVNNFPLVKHRLIDQFDEFYALVLSIGSGDNSMVF